MFATSNELSDMEPKRKNKDSLEELFDSTKNLGKQAQTITIGFSPVDLENEVFVDAEEFLQRQASAEKPLEPSVVELDAHGFGCATDSPELFFAEKSRSLKAINFGAANDKESQEDEINNLSFELDNALLNDVSSEVSPWKSNEKMYYKNPGNSPIFKGTSKSIISPNSRHTNEKHSSSGDHRDASFNSPKNEISSQSKRSSSSFPSFQGVLSPSLAHRQSPQDKHPFQLNLSISQEVSNSNGQVDQSSTEFNHLNGSFPENKSSQFERIVTGIAPYHNFRGSIPVNILIDPHKAVRDAIQAAIAVPSTERANMNWTHPVHPSQVANVSLDAVVAVQAMVEATNAVQASVAEVLRLRSLAQRAVEEAVVSEAMAIADYAKSNTEYTPSLMGPEYSVKGCGDGDEKTQLKDDHEIQSQYKENGVTSVKDSNSNVIGPIMPSGRLLDRDRTNTQSNGPRSVTPKLDRQGRNGSRANAGDLIYLSSSQISQVDQTNTRARRRCVHQCDLDEMRWLQCSSTPSSTHQEYMMHTVGRDNNQLKSHVEDQNWDLVANGLENKLPLLVEKKKFTPNAQNERQESCNRHFHRNAQASHVQPPISFGDTCSEGRQKANFLFTASHDVINQHLKDKKSLVHDDHRPVNDKKHGISDEFVPESVVFNPTVISSEEKQFVFEQPNENLTRHRAVTRGTFRGNYEGENRISHIPSMPPSNDIPLENTFYDPATSYSAVCSGINRPKLCKRFLCTIGGEIAETFLFRNTSSNYARICASIVPLSRGCNQFRITPPVLEMPPYASDHFVIRFVATQLGAVSGIFQFRSMSGDPFATPYEIIVDAHVKDSSASKPAIPGSDEVRRIDMIDIHPTYVRVEKGGHSSFEITNISIIPQHGVIPANGKTNVRVSVSEESPEIFQNTWCGSISVDVNGKFVREVSIVIDPSIYLGCFYEQIKQAEKGALFFYWKY
ncbi:hypothetical protein AeRB84_015496 [Aphanomyces euteiches]|nr:hypothetical protein AeRB84_015496 [Aphanomyces euteiches]